MASALAVTSPTITPPISPGPAVAAIGIDIGQRHPGIGQHFGDQRRQPLDMRARGDFGHHPAIGPVRLVLRGNPLRQNDARRRVTSAAAVSSHEISMPRTISIPASP